jgi:hypothetical protein
MSRAQRSPVPAEDDAVTAADSEISAALAEIRAVTAEIRAQLMRVRSRPGNSDSDIACALVLLDGRLAESNDRLDIAAGAAFDAREAFVRGVTAGARTCIPGRPATVTSLHAV